MSNEVRQCKCLAILLQSFRFINCCCSELHHNNTTDLKMPKYYFSMVFIHLCRSLTSAFCVCTVASVPTSKHWIKSAQLSDIVKFRTRVRFAILCGATRKRSILGRSVREVRDGCLGQKSLRRFENCKKSSSCCCKLLYLVLFSVYFLQFVHINNLKLICRAHQLVHEGTNIMFFTTHS